MPAIPEWDKQFHIQVAKATQNSRAGDPDRAALAASRAQPYWRKLHEHIDDKAISSWCDDHDQILKALMRKDPQAAKLAMWQHLENTKQMLFQATIFDDEMEDDRYLFSENPVVHLTQHSTANGWWKFSGRILEAVSTHGGAGLMA